MPSVFRLLHVESLFFASVGLLYLAFPHVAAQAFFFLGSMIPYPLPWVPAPFERFMTQPKLVDSWDSILLGVRAMALWELAVAALCWRWGSSLLAAQRRQQDQLAKKSKRGSAVHSRIESYETGIGVAVRDNYTPPPVLLLCLVHVGLALAFYRLPSLRVFAPLEVTQWSCDVVMASHALWALSNLVCVVKARSLWGGASAAQADNKAAAAKAE